MLEVGQPAGQSSMVDEILTLIVQHYVIAGLIALAFGAILNVAITASPEIMQSMRRHKLY